LVVYTDKSVDKFFAPSITEIAASETHIGGCGGVTEDCIAYDDQGTTYGYSDDWTTQQSIRFPNSLSPILASPAGF
jgi:hypothetical protein